MSFLRVNDLLLVYIFQNHDADSPFLLKNMFSLKINKKSPLKSVATSCGRSWQSGSLRQD